MNLLEYEAKGLLKDCGVPVPASLLWKKGDSSPGHFPVIIKSQVPVGGRGKAGGVKIANSSEEFELLAKEILSLSIKGFYPKTLLIEEKISIKKELYLSLVLNRDTHSIELIAHTQGGVDIEDSAEDDLFRQEITKDTIPAVITNLTDFLSLPEVSFALEDIIERLFACFFKNDMTLLEINPLIVTNDNQLVAGDAKITVDDAALFRHPEWNFENIHTNNNFVTLNPDGNVATVANGAGLAMATVDAVKAAGLTPANFLDIGGGADTKSILAAFKKIAHYPHVQAIIINIFAGITRCDEVARAVIAAKNELPDLPNLFIRLAGTNFEEAKEILKKEDYFLLPSLEDCIINAKEFIK